MVGAAILGAGIFAETATLPAVQASTTLQLRAIWSRSEKSVTALQQHIESSTTGAKAGALKVYWDSPAPSTPGRTLEDLLADADVAVVIMALPIPSQPVVVRRALAAGKHVLSEKPVAKDVASAREMIAWYEGLALTAGTARPRAIWGVAENYRYQPSLVFAAAELARIGGDVVTFSLRKHASAWAAGRRVPSYQGGYLLDGGVHFAAALRKLLAAAGAGGEPQNELLRVVGFTAQLEEGLPPADTIIGVAQTRGGRSGTVAISFGTEFKSGVKIEVVTTRGAVAWSPELVTTVAAAEEKEEGGAGEGGGGGQRRKHKTETLFPYDTGVAAEVEAFGRSVLAGRIDPGLCPQEALKDLEIIEGFLGSGEAGALVKTLE